MQSRGAMARLGLARNPSGLAAEVGAAAIKATVSSQPAKRRTALLVCDMTEELVGVLPIQSQSRLITSVNGAVEAAAQRGAAVIFTRIGLPGSIGGVGDSRMPIGTMTPATIDRSFGGGPAAPDNNNAADLLTFDLHASKNKLLVQLQSMGFLDPASERSKLHKDLLIPPGAVEIQKPRLSAFCGTALDRMLRGNNVEDVAIVGISSSGAGEWCEQKTRDKCDACTTWG